MHRWMQILIFGQVHHLPDRPQCSLWGFGWHPYHAARTLHCCPQLVQAIRHCWFRFRPFLTWRRNEPRRQLAERPSSTAPQALQCCLFGFSIPAAILDPLPRRLWPIPHPNCPFLRPAAIICSLGTSTLPLQITTIHQHALHAHIVHLLYYHVPICSSAMGSLRLIFSRQCLCAIGVLPDSGLKHKFPKWSNIEMDLTCSCSLLFGCLP